MGSRFGNSLPEPKAGAFGIASLARTCQLPTTQENLVKYLTLTLRYSVGFVSHLPLLCWGYPLVNIRHSRRSKSYTASLALQPLSLRREPTQKPCFPRQKTISYDKLGLYFTLERIPITSGLYFPPFSRSYPW